MVTYQSATQLKTPAKVYWAFKMVSQFGSLDYTIMGKTADLTVVQKTIIDTLHKEGKPQTFITKEAGCSQSAVSKHFNRKLMHWMYLIHEFHNLSWITEINELFHDILIYWDAPVDTALYF